MPVLPRQSFVETTITVPVDGRDRIFYGVTDDEGHQYVWCFRAGGAVEAFPGRDPKSLPTTEGTEGRLLVPLTPENWGVQPGPRGSTLVATEVARARRRDELRGLGSPAAAPAPAPAAVPVAGVAFGVPRPTTTLGAPGKVAAPPPAPPAAKPDDARVIALYERTMTVEEAIAGLTAAEIVALTAAVKALKEHREAEETARAAAKEALKQLVGEVPGVVTPVAPTAYDAPADADADDDGIDLDDEEAPVAGVG